MAAAEVDGDARVGASVAGRPPRDALGTPHRLGLTLLRGPARARRLGSWQGGRRRGLIGLALGAWPVVVGVQVGYAIPKWRLGTVAKYLYQYYAEDRFKGHEFTLTIGYQFF